jgi:hypothetical protein
LDVDIVCTPKNFEKIVNIMMERDGENACRKRMVAVFWDVIVYQITRRPFPEDSNLHSHCHEDHKTRRVWKKWKNKSEGRDEGCKWEWTKFIQERHELTLHVAHCILTVKQFLLLKEMQCVFCGVEAELSLLLASGSFLAYSLTLKMEGIYSSKMLGCLLTMQHYNLKT